MICYRDKTFCPFWERCKDGLICHRALTDKVREQAVIWWGDQNAPICQYMSEPECFKPLNPVTKYNLYPYKD